MDKMQSILDELDKLNNTALDMDVTLLDKKIDQARRRGACFGGRQRAGGRGEGRRGSEGALGVPTEASRVLPALSTLPQPSHNPPSTLQTLPPP